MGLDIESAFNKNNVFIKINYYAYGNSNELNGVDDFVGIEEFKQVIKTEYPNSYVRPIPTGRGGDGVYQFLIEVIIPSLPLTYVLNSIAGGFIHDAFKALFGKLYLGVKSLTAKNQNPETKQNIEHLISRIKLEFQNTTVFYYCWDNSEFYVDMAESFKCLNENYDLIHNFGYSKKAEPSFILFPVLPVKFAFDPELISNNYITFISPEQADTTKLKKKEFYRYFSAYYPIGSNLVIDTQKNSVSEEHLDALDVFNKAFP